MERGYIGGSNVAGILGLSPWSSPWVEWAKLVGLLPEESDNDRFAIGRALEGGIGQLFTRETGLYIAGEQMQLSHPETAMFRGHTDGLVFPGEVEEPSIDRAIAGLEIKTQGGREWDEVPPYYLAQANHYMWLSGLPKWYFAVLFGGFTLSFRVYEVSDQEDVDFQAERVQEFLERYVLTGTPPPVDGSDATTAAIGAVWPQHDPGTTVELDAELVADISYRNQLKADIKAKKEQLDTVDNRLREAIGAAEVATARGVPVLSLRAQERRGIDTDGLRRDMPLIAEQYTTTTTYRVLRPAPKTTRKAAAA